LVHDWSAAEDLLQETAQVMWSKFDTFKPGTDFTAWALCIARYQVLDYRKRCKSRVVFDSELIERLARQAEKHSVRDNGRRHEALKECLKKLTNRDRHLLELRYQLDASVRSIAETLGWHTKSVYRSLQRIRFQLFQCVRRTAV
jgi:RNA polymerase sigma-70 factor (ECF subfamily)